MQPFRIHILGCGSALPTLRHFPSSQVVELREKMFLVDCGEGAQIQLRRSHIHFSKVIGVFITHLHGDHCFGLLGLINTLGMLGRTSPLHIYAPKEMETIFQPQLDIFCKNPGYEIVYHPIDTTQHLTIFETHSMTVETVPLDHRVPCCGYLFKEKALMPHIRRDMIDYLGIPVSQINNIKNGADWTTNDGRIIPNSELTTPADKPRSYAYITDTKYLPQLHTLLKDVDVLYHESTYCDDNEQKAATFHHSTARQAATVALQAHAGKLILGHYSSRYEDESIFLNQAREVFTNTVLSDEMMTFDV